MLGVPDARGAQIRGSLDAGVPDARGSWIQRMLGISNAGGPGCRGPGYAEHLALVWPGLATELTGSSEQAARGGLSALLARFPHNLFKTSDCSFFNGVADPEVAATREAWMEYQPL